MTTFVLISEAENGKIFERVQEIYPGDSSIKIDPITILIHSETEALAKQVCTKIEGEGESAFNINGTGKYVVFSINSFHGYHLKSMWDWLNTKGV